MKSRIPGLVGETFATVLIASNVSGVVAYAARHAQPLGFIAAVMAWVTVAVLWAVHTGLRHD